MATDEKMSLAARAGYEAAGGKLGGVERAQDVRTEDAEATTPPRDPNAPPETMDLEFHAKALFTVYAQAMRGAGHSPPAWNALPEATRSTFVTALASIPTK